MRWRWIGLVSLPLVLGCGPSSGSQASAAKRPAKSAPGTADTAVAIMAHPSSSVPLLPPLPAATSTASVAPKPPRAPSLSAAVQRLLGKPVSGFVMMARDTKAYATLEKARASPAEVGRMLELDTSDADGACRGGVSYRVVRDQGDLVEVETPLPKETSADCFGTAHYDWDDVQIRTVVRKKDLLPVLRTTLEVSFDDGTGASIAPGAPVTEPEVPVHGGWAVCASGLPMELPISASEIALSYRPTRLTTTTRTDSLEDEDLLYLRGTPWIRADGLPGSLQNVQRERQQGEMKLLELGSTCVKLWLSTPERRKPPQVGSGGGGGAVGIGGLGRGSSKPKMKKVKRYYMRKGATVYWESGPTAGKTLRRRMLRGAGTQVGHRHCYEFKIGVGERLCFGPGGREVRMEEVRRW